MIRLLKVFCFTFLMVSCQKNDDESRPYEFGFTIDGQQHRHEKKDVNGIIQGEFGFITADGIYHVTVYATDENGNFKILSMRNIRISAPLDGSPLPPGAKIEGNPASKQVQTQPQTPQVQQPKNDYQIDNRVKPTQTTTRPRVTYAFTTQPTIKPACGGCGYVTTPKPRPGELFPFQTPAFQKPNYGNQNSQLNNPILNQNQQNAAVPPQISTQEITNRNPSFPNNQESLSQNPALSNYQLYPGSGAQNPALSNNQLNPGLISQNPAFLNNQVDPGFNSQNPIPNSQLTQQIPNQGSNEIDLNNRPRKPLSQVSVSNGAIHVPGNPDIPIRDKFPGMTDGLPAGISKKDITDLLYKFNYTVGFHGHYEKGLKNGTKVGGYFVTGRDGISRIVTYVADENGFRPKVKFVRLDLSSDEVPKEGSEKTFGLKNFEFVWYPVS